MNPATRSITFTGLNAVELTVTPGLPATPDDGILLETRYSCVSAGTELAKLTGLQKIRFPACLGNRAVGRLAAIGPRAREAHPGLAPGALVFAHTPHASHAPHSGFFAPLPDALDTPASALLGLAMVSLVGVQQLSPHLGDTAVVTGAGLVGNLAAQLLELSGVRTLLADQVPERLALAAACGVTHTVSGTPEEIARQVRDLTRGEGATFGLECTGVPAVIRQLPALLARRGHLVLVGSPRGESNDMTAFLNHFHLWQPHGDLTLSGAHEWKIPMRPDPFARHSMAGNLSLLADLVLGGRLKLQPLLTHVLNPAAAAEGYRLLDTQKHAALGVVFDWTRA